MTKRAVKYYECKECGDEWCMKELQSYKFLNDNDHWAYKCPNCGCTFFYIYDSNERFRESYEDLITNFIHILKKADYDVLESPNSYLKDQIKIWEGRKK